MKVEVREQALRSSKDEMKDETKRRQFRKVCAPRALLDSSISPLLRLRSESCNTILSESLLA